MKFGVHKVKKLPDPKFNLRIKWDSVSNIGYFLGNWPLKCARYMLEGNRMHHLSMLPYLGIILI